MHKLKTIIDNTKKYAGTLKKDILALYLASKRKDVPWYAKAVLLFVAGYALSPIDLIPDFIPILGYLDDLLIVPLGISLAIRLVPKTVLEECRAQAGELCRAGKPKNWIAGGIIIAIWLLALLWIVSIFLHR